MKKWNFHHYKGDCGRIELFHTDTILLGLSNNFYAAWFKSYILEHELFSSGPPNRISHFRAHSSRRIFAHRPLDNVLMITVYYGVSESFSSIAEIRWLPFGNEVLEATRIVEDGLTRTPRTRSVLRSRNMELQANPEDHKYAEVDILVRITLSVQVS